MRDHRVGSPFHRVVEELARRGDRGDDPFDFGSAFYLEAVWAVVGRTLGLEQIVQFCDQLQEVHAAMVPQPEIAVVLQSSRIVKVVHTKNPGIVSTIVVLTLLAAACARVDKDTQREFTVRMLTSRTVSGRLERAAERGLGRIAAELGADVARVRFDDPADLSARLAEVGRSGPDLVFCVGAGFEPVLYAEAVGFPGTAFVLMPGRATAANVAGIEFLPEEAGYLAGAAAGVLAADRRLGLLRGGGQPWLESLEEGFVAGYRSRQSRITVTVAEGADGVWKLKAAGVPLALYACDSADPAVLAATRNAGLMLVVTDPEVLDLDPESVIAAVNVDVSEAMLRVAREVRDGPFVGRVFAFDLGSGVVDVVINPSLEPDELAAASTAIDEARAEVTAGLVEFDELGL
jgi:basic membrane protein A